MNRNQFSENNSNKPKTFQLFSSVPNNIHKDFINIVALDSIFTQVDAYVCLKNLNLVLQATCVVFDLYKKGLHCFCVRCNKNIQKFISLLFTSKIGKYFSAIPKSNFSSLRPYISINCLQLFSCSKMVRSEWQQINDDDKFNKFNYLVSPREQKWKFVYVRKCT